MPEYLLGDGSGGRIGLVVGAPVVLVDGDLAAGASTPRLATGGGGGTLGVSEVETKIRWSAIIYTRKHIDTHVLLRTITRASESPR